MAADLRFQLALTFTPNVGSKTARMLLRHFESGEAVLKASMDELLSIDGVNKRIAESVLASDFLAKAEQEISWCEKHDVHIHSVLDPDYPYRLLNIPDPPVIYYRQGQHILNESRMLAIIGTRKPTEKGQLWVDQLVEELRPYHPTILSGLAYGVDITAHRAALRQGLKTVAVLGSGLDKVYPRAHAKTAREMQKNGAIITEQLHDAEPDRENFPMRNRIIAGLCDALIIVESASEGGSMITVKLANEYHRDVYARPGRPDDEMSAGCNMLIKSHRAELIESVKDLIYHTSWRAEEGSAPVQRQLFVELTADEQELVKIFHVHKEITIERLAIESQWPVSRLSPVLLGLEFKGMVKSLPGSRYLYIN